MAPVASTLSKIVLDAYADVARNPNNLLTMSSDGLSRFRFVCPELEDTSNGDAKANPRGTVRGVWREASGGKLLIPLIGVIDRANCKIGAYGNLDSFNEPTLKKLKSCKFIIALTHPDFKEGHPDVAIAEGIINQMMRISDMQGAVNARLTEAVRYNNAVRFANKSGEFTGTIVTTLGVVFLPSVQETTAEEFLKRSPTKKQAPKDDKPLPNIVCDPSFWTKCIPGADILKHNDKLPIRYLDGSSVGRTGDELSSVLADGRWVRVDCELVMWNITDDKGTVRTFQLAVDSMIVLPIILAPPIVGPGMTYAPLSSKAYETCPPSDDAKATGESSDAAQTTGDQGGDVKQDSEGSSETMSSGNASSGKREHSPSAESASKKVKTGK